ncbi:type II toxin-antitoxin system Phd/YefM family antitoxin [Lelliottia sp. CFBP8978]|uniref:type II toxin-antitoxin system Phd/YefM family antitoxin n=1 Tax=Lelliottia sp. CFBP8978 TaxID=3096522 RepID=UPI002A69AD2B|nr:type II toxin-antitoxin system Phd/YefM family antitoxin [Lelliottia sp. CFBP8978]MDY1037757.1 type II toxin-antitoxin system Phd/YefM family antitoxin [Lelliottia sp. CFBP8978]
MRTVTSTELRQTLAPVLDEVSASRAPMMITRQGAENVVMIAESEWEAIQETLHLFGNPANAAHLMESIAQAERGEVSGFDLNSGTFK